MVAAEVDQSIDELAASGTKSCCFHQSCRRGLWTMLCEAFVDGRASFIPVSVHTCHPSPQMERALGNGEGREQQCFQHFLAGVSMCMFRQASGLALVPEGLAVGGLGGLADLPALCALAFDLFEAGK